MASCRGEHEAAGAAVRCALASAGCSSGHRGWETVRRLVTRAANAADAEGRRARYHTLVLFGRVAFHLRCCCSSPAFFFVVASLVADLGSSFLRCEASKQEQVLHACLRRRARPGVRRRPRTGPSADTFWALKSWVVGCWRGREKCARQATTRQPRPARSRSPLAGPLAVGRGPAACLPLACPAAAEMGRSQFPYVALLLLGLVALAGAQTVIPLTVSTTTTGTTQLLTGAAGRPAGLTQHLVMLHKSSFILTTIFARTSPGVNVGHNQPGSGWIQYLQRLGVTSEYR